MKARHLGQTALALAGGYLAALAVTRRWHQHWGATDQEIINPLPGDDFIPAPKLNPRHHHPRPRRPDLALAGPDGLRGPRGTYSYDQFERRAGRNLYQLDPDIRPLATEGAMPFAPGLPMTVGVADPPHALVLWQVTASGKAIEPTGPWGDDHVAWSWAFILEPVDSATTRLLVRMRVSYQPVAKWGPYMWLLVEPAHFIMGRRQLLGIRQRAEAAPARWRPAADKATRAGKLRNPRRGAWHLAQAGSTRCPPRAQATAVRRAAGGCRARPGGPPWWRDQPATGGDRLGQALKVPFEAGGGVHLRRPCHGVAWVA